MSNENTKESDMNNAATETRTSKEISAEIRAMNNKINTLNDLQNEGGEGYEHTIDTSALEAEYYAAKKAEKEL